MMPKPLPIIDEITEPIDLVKLTIDVQKLFETNSIINQKKEQKEKDVSQIVKDKLADWNSIKLNLKEVPNINNIINKAKAKANFKIVIKDGIDLAQNFIIAFNILNNLPENAQIKSIKEFFYSLDGIKDFMSNVLFYNSASDKSSYKQKILDYVKDYDQLLWLLVGLFEGKLDFNKEDE